MAFVYSGKFEQNLNASYSRANVKKTAKKFKVHEKKHGYSFGDKFTKTLIPKAADWADASGSTAGHAKWEKHLKTMPEAARKKITQAISTNLKSAHPLPIVFKIGENVDATHDVHIRTFSHKGHMYIGVHVLCPNTSLK
jgi:hypothetical protein